MKDIYSDTAILFLSCDKYSDLWNPLFRQFKKQWPDCPFRMYLGSNTKSYDDMSIQTILSGKGIDWSTDLLSILKLMKEKYIFVWIDDFFPISQIDTQLFLKCFQFMKKTQANHIHSGPGIRLEKKENNKLFRVCEKGILYRVNANGFWRKKHLEKMLIPGENPWNFEIMGSYRSSYFENYFCVNTPLFKILRVVDKGSITRQAYLYCKRHSIILDTSTRHVSSFFEGIKGDIQTFVFKSVMNIPWRLRVQLMEKLRRIVISY